MAIRRSRSLKMLVGAVIVFLGIALITGGFRTAPTPEAFAGALSLGDALDEAAKTGKPVLAFVTADWCPPCQKFKRGALIDKDVARWILDNTHPVLVDATKANPDASRLGVEAIPTLVMIRDDEKGEREVARFSGDRDAAFVLDWLRQFSGPVQDYKARTGRLPPGFEEEQAKSSKGK